MKLLKLIPTPLFAIVLMLLYALMLAVATFIEKYYGTPAAKMAVYYSPLSLLVQLLLVLSFFGLVFRLRKAFPWRRLGFWFTHLAFVLLIVGACATHFLSKEGFIHIRQGDSSNVLLIQQPDQPMQQEELPFTLELLDFRLIRYPGSSSPSAYESDLLVHVDGQSYPAYIRMNKVVEVKGYRLFQASYDQDEQGTILSVNRDIIGHDITFTGYFFLFVGLLLSLVTSRSRVGILYARLKKLHAREAALMLALLFSLPMAAENHPAYETIQRYAVSPEHAAKFGQLPVQTFQGRMSPVNTFAAEMLRKVTKQHKIGKLNAEQVLLSMYVMPEEWMKLKIVVVDSPELSQRFQLSNPNSAYVEFFDANGQYKLKDAVEAVYRKQNADRTGTDKDLMKIDERINLLHQLLNRMLLNIFPLPNDSTHAWFSPADDLSRFSGKDSMFVTQIFNWYTDEVATGIRTGQWKGADDVLDMIDTYQQSKAEGVDISHNRMKAEVTYNKLDVFRYAKMGYLILGGISLVWAILCMLGAKPRRAVKYLFVTLGLLFFAYHTFGMGMRWYVSGYAPWSNSYESMVYVAWSTVLAGLLFVRKNDVVFSLGLLFGGVILFVSTLSWMDPQITPLVPVLKSPWLMFHVAVIVAAYGFFGLGSLMGLTNMILMICRPRATTRQSLLSDRITELTLLNEVALWIGLVLMTIGTFLGAIWADVSWGRYWGWDPKETWALITMFVYAIITHLHLMKVKRMEWLFNLLSVLGLSSVLMTFFGVNYLLSGLHSYGENAQIYNLFGWILLAYAVVAVIAVWSYKSCRQK